MGPLTPQGSAHVSTRTTPWRSRPPHPRHCSIDRPTRPNGFRRFPTATMLSRRVVIIEVPAATHGPRGLRWERPRPAPVRIARRRHALHRVRAASYAPLERGHPGNDQSLVIHAHEQTPEAAQLVLFVHGLGGRRYRTWRQFPRFIFEDLPDSDVGLFDYVSGTRRIRRAKSFRLNAIAEELSETVRELPYSRVVLLGHSMGGLLCMAAIRHMLDNRSIASGTPACSTIERISGLFLLACPLAGSAKASRPISDLSVDGRALGMHSHFVTDLHDYFKNQIKGDCNAAEATDKRCLPTYAVVAMRDRVVDRLSSQLNINGNCVRHVRANHTGVVKPNSREDDAYNWVQAKIQDCLEHRCARKLRVELPEERSVIRMDEDAFARLLPKLGSVPNGFRIDIAPRGRGADEYH